MISKSVGEVNETSDGNNHTVSRITDKRNAKKHNVLLN